MRAALAIALLLLAPAARAQSLYDGAWTFLGIASCNPASDAVVRIQGNRMRYWESGCELSNPVPVNGLDATLYDARCSGEGEEWQTRMMLMLTPEGTLLHVNRYNAQVLTACPGGTTDQYSPTK
ncbi:MAG: hypothetical protein KDK12_13235 [Rhodobacteraceae bacterium]|nr:hypothetical protein [Paracoccaceae bacterium]